MGSIGIVVKICFATGWTWEGGGGTTGVKLADPTGKPVESFVEFLDGVVLFCRYSRGAFTRSRTQEKRLVALAVG